MKSRVRWNLVIAFGLASCVTRETDSALFIEDFQTLCDQVPCGWEVRNESGQALVVETLPGDLGLRLLGPTQVVRDSGFATTPRLTHSLALRIRARCDVGSELRVQVVLALAGVSEPQTFDFGLLVPLPEWSSVLDASTWVANDFEPARIESVVAIGIAKEGAGACELDFLSVHPQ